MPEKGKTRISIFIDNVVLDGFRTRAEKAGTGYQTMMNEALRRYLSEAEQPVTETILRQVLRQEIPEYLHRAAVSGRLAKTKSHKSTAVRAKVAARGLTEKDVSNAVVWARTPRRKTRK